MKILVFGILIWFSCGLIAVIIKAITQWYDENNINLSDILFFILIIVGGIISFVFSLILLTKFIDNHDIILIKGRGWKQKEEIEKKVIKELKDKLKKEKDKVVTKKTADEIKEEKFS